MTKDAESTLRCGFAAVVGRPNVGKSTLINALLKRKVSITSPKPQTTRHRILGIKTSGDAQIVFVDTPGINYAETRALNRYMNRAAHGAIEDVDVVVFVAEALKWSPQDQRVEERIKGSKRPIILVLNKIDRVRPRSGLLPFIDELARDHGFDEIVPISARRGENLEALESAIKRRLPRGEPLFPEDMITDRSERFHAAELIREKLILRLSQEVPYRLSVEIEEMAARHGVLHINAVIWVERPGQKAIVIGRKGELLKQVGISARREMQRLFGQRVDLRLWVKVKDDWSDNDRALASLGYIE
ncbi:MAG TPA: GTPase Era [Gammaproteobacteria bacterium]|nr:GTPase Era [Gammaproteobacteria bacterium]